MMARVAKGLAVLLLAVLAAACARHEPAAKNHGDRVAITVTKKGFEPAVVTVPAGRPVTLVVTRTTELTCARDFIMPARNIVRSLPLDEPVEILLGPEKPGTLPYSCAMDMFRGSVAVE